MYTGGTDGGYFKVGRRTLLLHFAGRWRFTIGRTGGEEKMAFSRVLLCPEIFSLSLKCVKGRNQ